MRCLPWMMVLAIHAAGTAPSDAGETDEIPGKPSAAQRAAVMSETASVTQDASLRAAWLKSQGQPGYDRHNDLNGDGVVNFLDLQAMRSRTSPAGAARGAPTIEVTMTLDDDALLIGETTTLRVFVEITAGATADNGIYAYALNVLNDMIGIAGVSGVVQLGSPDPFFSDPGAIEPGGVRDIYGGDGGFFGDRNRGIGGPFELLNIEIAALSDGTVSFAAGVADSAGMIGVPDGFLVQQPGPVNVVFGPGVTLTVAFRDCNTNGVPDDSELAGNDCNANGVPDECDVAGGTSPDCNSNGLPDDCDISAGAADLNTNGIPDECEITDCNANGVEDGDDIAVGTSDDCNTNGIPDECDIAAGTALGCLTLTLNADAEFYLPGQTVTVTVDMTKADTEILGGQFFLSYDMARLQFLGMDPGDAPFSQQIFEVVGLGTIDYAVGVVSGNPGTLADSTMAVVRFTALGTVCGMSDLVAFRPNEPPTALTNAEGGAELPVELVNVGMLTIDGTAPSLSCPGNLTVECTASTDPSNTGTAATSDNCGAAVDLVYEDDATPTACPGVSNIARTWRATDQAGNVRQCVQTINVRDTTEPVVTCPADIAVSAAPGACGASLDPGAATAMDACDPGLTVVGTRSDALPLVGEYDSGVTTITWEATDCAGNADFCVQTVTVSDDEDPVIVCPADITVNADAGGTDAFVTVPPPASIEDNCGIADVINDYNGSVNASDLYPQGTTVVTWFVTDVFGNVHSCVQNVTVEPFNELVVSVQFSPTVSSSFQRCITLELSDCGASNSVEVDWEIPFTFGLALEHTVLVPAGAWNCITARDRLHTLRRTDQNFRIVGTRYVASFTGDVNQGGDWLIGGNLNDDPFIDILDFALLSMEWGRHYDSNGDLIADGSTDCMDAGPHADITGNGVVNLGDFTFIQIHFLEQSEGNCCGFGRFSEGPRASVSVSELRRMGYPDAELADFDGDGMVDAMDLVAVMQGAEP